MIEWLIQRAADDHQVARGRPPAGLLSARETAVFESLHSTKRRRDWLLGRWTGKRLLQAVAAKSGRQSMTSDEISILAAEDGAPEVWFAVQGCLERGNFAITISHSQGVSLCAVTGSSSYHLGADIEHIAPRSARFVTDYFSDVEQAIVRGTPPQQRDSLITAIWSGKESALKAVREGLRLDTRVVSCIFPAPFAAAVDWQPFTIQWREHDGRRLQPRLKGWWRIWEDFVLTLVIGQGQLF